MQSLFREELSVSQHAHNSTFYGVECLTMWNTTPGHSSLVYQLQKTAACSTSRLK